MSPPLVIKIFTAVVMGDSNLMSPTVTTRLSSGSLKKTKIRFDDLLN